MRKLRQDERVSGMYRDYLSGMSLSEVAAKYRITRQSVYKCFSRRSLKLRKRPQSKNYVEFNGSRYTKGTLGYWRKTVGDRSLLHRDVWVYHKGEIPDGWDIHHIDEDKDNNDISNFECLPKAEHTRQYSPGHNQYTPKELRKRANA
ncbi:HNH endonuclease [Paenibacillus sp. UKAQ_18]|nr:HNH endonuclease [Paenibacillus sp. UKAQ_18]MCF2719266.1 HNH endonuclease [Paenibacillus sp. UKAQ_18]